MATPQWLRQSTSFPCSSPTLARRHDAAAGYRSPLKPCCALSTRKAESGGRNSSSQRATGVSLRGCVCQSNAPRSPAPTTVIAVRSECSRTVASYRTGHPGSPSNGPCTFPCPALNSTGAFLLRLCPSPLHRISRGCHSHLFGFLMAVPTTPQSLLASFP